MSYSKSLVYKWRMYLDRAGFSYDETEISEDVYGISIFGLKVENKLERIAIFIVCFENSFYVEGVCHQHVPLEQRTEMALLIARLNDGAVGGFFMMDCSDGKIRCRELMNYAGSTVSMEMISDAFEKVYYRFTKWGDALNDIIYGKANAEDAYNVCR